MKKKLLSFLCITVVLSMLLGVSASALSLKDGTYHAKLKTSYANPATGKPVDGGTNIALGDGMCKSIVEESLLIEQSHGKTYVTIGLGMMSNVENVRIQIQGKDGEYRTVPAKKVGSCVRNHDTCNHYRFEVESADKNISPILYVKPMGRDVQFFIIPNTATVAPGTGNFGKPDTPNPNKPDQGQTPDKGNSSNGDKTPSPNNNKVPSNNKPASNQNANPANPSKNPASVATTAKQESATQVIDIAQITSAQDVTEENSNVESTSDEAQETQEETTKKSHMVWWIVGGVIVVLAGGAAAWYFCYFKKKQQ